MHATRWRQHHLQPQNDNGRRRGRATGESTENIRKGLLADIRTKVSKAQPIDSIEVYGDRLEKCVIDSKERSQTLLHWIVTQVETQDREAPDAEDFKLAAQKMVQLAMKFNDKLISEVDNAGETALHHALTSHDDRVSSLIETMCDHDGGKEYLQRAIAHANNDGDNCLHLAIDHRPDIAEKLISIANEAAFCQKRCRNKKHIGQASPDHGNTPLHDAVSYERGVINKPHCLNPTNGNQCERCHVLTMEYNQAVSDATMLVIRLIERCDKALKIKNDNDESPFLYYLRTKAEFQPEEANKNSVAAFREPTACCASPNNEASMSIESHLIESAFFVGGFKDACACFFGDKADQDGKSWPLRPGYPIMVKSHETYKQFIPQGTHVISHVDLQIGRSASSQTDKPTHPAVRKGGGSSTVLRQEIEPANEHGDDDDRIIAQWQNDMLSLTKIFKMLKQQGVKRILKVTIKDNSKRPCSDQVIQQCLAGFDVRYLDWNKPDLSVSIICASCPKIAELTLYSSGRRAVLESWASNTGLCRLRQLLRVNLETVAGLEEYGVYKTIVDGFQTELIENIQLIRRKLVLASIMETCELEIQDLEDYVRNLAISNENGDDPDPYPEMLEDKRKKIETYRKDLASLEREGANLEAQRLNLLLGNTGVATVTAANAVSHEFGKNGGDGNSDGNNRPPADKGKLFDGLNFREIPTATSRKWLYGADYDVASTMGSRLCKTTTKVDDYSPGSIVSLEFEAKIFMESPTSSHQGTVRTVTNSDGTIIEVSTALEENRWLKAVYRFVRKWVQTPEIEKWEPVKVALIDDGIDIRQFEHSVHHPGWPPAKPYSDEKLWYHSERGHGTIMAKMIYKMCPRVELFVAKLADFHDPKKLDNADKAADAIAWAIENRVDIISMSWSLVASDDNKDGISKLERKIKEAADAKILLYCAAADKAGFVKNDTLFPHSSRTPYIRIVGSAKETGGESTFVDPTQVHYLFPGERIPDLGETKGSSVATALAAGFAALILWCFRSKGESDKDIADPDGMHIVFQSLVKHPNKWVNVANLLGIDSVEDVDEVIKWCKSALYAENRR